MISSPIFNNNSKDANRPKIKITVRNNGKFNANNIKIEACFMNKENQTFHLISDLESFVILPSNYKWFLFIPYKSLRKDSQRVFQIREFHPSAFQYLEKRNLNYFIEGEYSLRVRIHAEHSFSGFGQSFEQIF